MKEINAVIVGTTGLIGKGVLIECLEHDAVKSVLAVGRRSCGVTHPKLTEILYDDFSDLSPIAEKIAGFNACYYCLGVSSVGMSEEEYSRITVNFTIAAADAMKRASNDVTFCFISGMGTDATMQSKTMWARVKGKAEHELKSFPFRQLFLLRPGFVQPVKGVKMNHLAYKLLLPLIPVLKLLFPKYVTTTEKIGRAMIQLTLYGGAKQTLENSDINECAMTN